MELDARFSGGIGFCTEIHFKMAAPMIHLFSKEDERNLLI
jgi:hypothetical protein